MEEEISISANDLPVTHFFLYKGKRFPFNMNIFNCFSQYFNSIEIQYEKNSSINLFDESDENQNISESSINDFINFCQKNTITLNKENVLSLHNLAKKFIVQSLIKATNNYMSTHQKDFVIDLLLLNLNDTDSANNQEYEEIISENLTEYFQDSRLLSFPLPVLHRIVTKYTQKNLNQDNSPEFIEFLFKCLDKFGREGSVLFDHVNIGRSCGTFLHRLLNEYSEKFDFHFINDQQLRTIYDIESEIIQKTQNLKESEKTTKADIEALNQKLSELKTENDRLRTTVEETNKNKDSQIKMIEETFTQMMNEIKVQIEQLNERITQQNFLITKLNDKVEKIKNNSISCRFLGESNLTGIITRFRDVITLSTGDECSSYPLTNILKYDNKEFYNSSKSETNSYIKFDFGSSKKIDLFSYFIRSNSQNAVTNAQHPKTWRIEGSSDDLHWTCLDRRENDQNLYGPYKQYYYVCKESKHADDSSRYRYIRYIQENSWWNGRPYYIGITYFELYGDVYIFNE